MENVGWTTGYAIAPVYNCPGGKKINIKMLCGAHYFFKIFNIWLKFSLGFRVYIYPKSPSINFFFFWFTWIVPLSISSCFGLPELSLFHFLLVLVSWFKTTPFPLSISSQSCGCSAAVLWCCSSSAPSFGVCSVDALHLFSRWLVDKGFRVTRSLPLSISYSQRCRGSALVSWCCSSSSSFGVSSVDVLHLFSRWLGDKGNIFLINLVLIKIDDSILVWVSWSFSSLNAELLVFCVISRDIDIKLLNVFHSDEVRAYKLYGVIVEQMSFVFVGLGFSRNMWLGWL